MRTHRGEVAVDRCGGADGVGGAGGTITPPIARMRVWRESPTGVAAVTAAGDGFVAFMGFSMNVTTAPDCTHTHIHIHVNECATR